MRYYDIHDRELIDPNLNEYELEPRETVHHDAVPEQKHIDVALVTPGGTKIMVEVVDTPGRPAWDEVTACTCIPKPPTADEMAEALAEVAGMAADNAEHLADLDEAVAELGGMIGGE